MKQINWKAGMTRRNFVRLSTATGFGILSSRRGFSEPRSIAKQNVMCAEGLSDFDADGEATKKRMEQVFADFDDWGFNTFGIHTPMPRKLYRHRFAYVQPIRTARIEMYWYDKNRELPDVFSEEFQRRVEEKARPIVLDCKDDPNLLGYAFSNIPPWTGYGRAKQFGDYDISPWIDAIRSLPAEAAGKKVWITLLQQRYSEAKMAAKSHDVSGTTWEKLADVTEWPTPTEKGPLADTEAFLASIAETWHRIHFEAIRRYDKNHLILGDWLMGNMAIPDFLMPILKKYVDVVVFRAYGYFKGQEPTLRRIYEATGKPIISGDSSFSRVQPNQKRAKGIHFDTDEKVGEAYADYLKAALSEPYMIGWHYCGYVEGWEGQAHWLCANQNGFKDLFENIHEDTVAHVRRANAQAIQWHADAGL